jgi:predicted dehydrogenase
MPERRYKVILVGLGTIARTHIEALKTISGAQIVCGVDIASRPRVIFKGRSVPVYQNIREARQHHDADIAVIATPTPSHLAVCREVAEYFPAARILVEKPAADKLADALYILEDIGSRQSVDVAYHMAFSPEVSWGVQTIREYSADIGTPVEIEADSADPYYDEFSKKHEILTDSWIDSGINSLSVLNRFVELVDAESVRRIGEVRKSVFEAHIKCRVGDRPLSALILTRWDVTDAARTTRIRYESGAQLVMDHTAVSGHFIKDNSITEIHGSDRTVARRERHYRALYEEWLVKGNRLMPADTSVLLHRLLLEPLSR